MYHLHNVSTKTINVFFAVFLLKILCTDFTKDLNSDKETIKHSTIILQELFNEKNTIFLLTLSLYAVIVLIDNSTIYFIDIVISTVIILYYISLQTMACFVGYC